VTDTTREQLALEVHGRPVRLVLATTGGGSRAISTLLTVPGASRTILAAVVPYASEALVEWLGGKPDEFCSEWTARAMAMASYRRASQYDPAATICGVACTASLASDRPKRGLHRAHLAWQSASTTVCASIELAKGRRTRSEEEDVVCDLLLNAVAEACGATGRLDVRLIENERVEQHRVTGPPDEQDLLAGRTQVVPRGAARQAELPRAVFPGAFNPLHDGHRAMARLAAAMLGVQVAYELSVVNVDKLPLDFIEIDRRLRQFAATDPVWLTRAPLYVQKAELFPGATFVVGADTIGRIGQSRYYDDQDALEKAIDEIASRGCRFLVFGREVEGVFRTLDNLDLPERLRQLCHQVPEEHFRDESSSTELRKRQNL
jgi:nicotinamide mononucleotide (NMN) deamidase PncC